MRRMNPVLVASCLMALAMLLAACAPSAPPAKPAATQPPAQATAPAPKATPTQPAAKPAVPSPAATPKPAAEQPKQGGMVETAAERDPADLDGLWGTSIIAQVFVNPSYNGLVQYDPLENTKIVPRLAEKWEVSADGKTVTFNLRKGVKWHDGQSFTAQDVKKTMDLWQTPPQGKMFLGGPLQQLTKAVDIIDDYTVKVTLQRRSNIYLAFLAAGNISAIGPKHILDKQNGVMRNTVIGTGPFKFKKYDAGVVYEVEKNRDYFIPGRPYLDGVRTYIIKDRSTMLAAFRAGRIKVTWVKAGTMFPSQAESIKKDMPLADAYTEDMLLAEAFYPNHKRAPWNDRRVRQAASLVVDRRAAVATMNEGVGAVGTQLPKSSLTLTPAELASKPGFRQPKDQDIAEAKRLLAEAGHPNGFKSTLLVRGGVKIYEDRAVFAKDQLAKIGIDLQFDIRDEAVWNRLRRDREFDSMVLAVVFYMADPLGGASYFGPNNEFNFENPKRDELMLKYDTADGEAAKKAAALEFEQFMMEEVPYVVFYWKPELRAHWKEIKNMKPATGMYNNNSFEAIYISK